jgi:hypothetical protein
MLDVSRPLRRLSALFCVLVLATCEACVHYVPLRTSSSRYLSREQQTVLLPWGPHRAERACKQFMDGAGMALAYALDAPDKSRVIVFSRDRNSVLNVSATQSAVFVDSYQIGSWIAVRVSPAPGGARVTAFAKPSLHGVEVCSDDDPSLADVRYWCFDTKVREDYDHRELVDGRIEAELVTRLVDALKDALIDDSDATEGQPLSGS